MDQDSQLTVSDDVVAREVSGEVVLLDLASGQYFGLDEIGGRIWSLLSEKPHSISTLCDHIEAEFDAARDRIEADLVALIKDLEGKSLISRVSA